MRFPIGLYRFWIPVTAIACVLVVAGLVQFAGRTKKIIFIKEDCNRIQIGMTREEVERTIGIPPTITIIFHRRLPLLTMV